MKLYTGKGVEFMVDDDDEFAVSRYSWFLDDVTGYLRTNVGKWPNRSWIRLHSFLLGKAPGGLEWDHINRNKLDNRRSNLRMVTHAMNMRNSGIQANNTSGASGVSFDKANGKWHARIGRSQIHLGRFASRDDAIAARLAAEAELW